MCLPKVKTAIEEPCTIIEAMTRKVVMGQISATSVKFGAPGSGYDAKGVAPPVSNSALARIATKIAPTPIGPK